jgi:hypothetical protein
MYEAHKFEQEGIKKRRSTVSIYIILVKAKIKWKNERYTIHETVLLRRVFCCRQKKYSKMKPLLDMYIVFNQIITNHYCEMRFLNCARAPTMLSIVSR